MAPLLMPSGCERPRLLAVLLLLLLLLLSLDLLMPLLLMLLPLVLLLAPLRCHWPRRLRKATIAAIFGSGGRVRPRRMLCRTMMRHRRLDGVKVVIPSVGGAIAKGTRLLTKCVIVAA